jgi:hypothetical protein
MTESRLQRWSRKKIETKKEPEISPPSSLEPAAPEPELSPEEQDLAINEALPEHEVLEKYSLPNPDAIELGTDITGFMRKEIPEFLRRRALRSLWKSNPVLAVLDGLNDYDEDFTNAASASSVVKTLYKVGQGFDRTPTPDVQVEERAPEQAVTPETSDSAGVAEDAVVEDEAAEPVTARYAEPVITGSESEPQYRPRMRFNY